MYYSVFDKNDVLLKETKYKNVKIFSFRDKYIVLSKKEKYKNLKLKDIRHTSLRTDIFVLTYNNKTNRMQMQISRFYVNKIKIYVSGLKKSVYRLDKQIFMSPDEYERRIKFVIDKLRMLSNYMLIYNDTRKSICKHIKKERYLFYTSVIKMKSTSVKPFVCSI